MYLYPQILLFSLQQWEHYRKPQLLKMYSTNDQVFTPNDRSITQFLYGRFMDHSARGDRKTVKVRGTEFGYEIMSLSNVRDAILINMAA